MTKSILMLMFVACVTAQSLAMKSRKQTFPQSCDVVWKATVVVAKGDQYRIVSISGEEQVISLVAGGAFWGERILSLSLAAGPEGGCTVKVQSRFSGTAHSDGPDLLLRIHIRLLGEELGTDSKTYQEFKACVEHGSYPDWGGGKPKCEELLLHKLKAKS
jgi:hypothetical protein